MAFGLARSWTRKSGPKRCNPAFWGVQRVVQMAVQTGVCTQRAGV